ncbi:putative aspartic peptidase domain superfamily [Arabidopsis thaliana]
MTMVQGNQEVFSTCGLIKNKELKFFGSISGHHVSVRIDSGATNNFMSKDLAIHFKLPRKETNLVSVLLGHGLHIKSKEKCMGIGLLIQGIEIIEDFLLVNENKTEASVILG